MKCIRLILLIMIGLVSCSKENDQYNFKIVNDTNLILERVTFRFSDQRDTFKLEPSDSTAFFVMSCNSKEYFAACSADVSVRVYIRENDTISNTCGIEFPRTGYIDEESIIFKISIDTIVSDSCPNDPFKIDY